jgi:hypothetical protein
MSQRVKTSARGLVLPRSSLPENGHLRKNTNTVTYFDWKTVIYIYACGKCRTQFM